MIDPLTPEGILGAALQVQLCSSRSLDVDFFPDRVRIRLPPKRTLAAATGVPLSQMTAVLSRMEQDGIIGTERRGGMWVAPAGNRILAGLLAGRYREQAREILGPVVLEALLLRLAGAPGPA